MIELYEAKDQSETLKNEDMVSNPLYQPFFIVYGSGGQGLKYLMRIIKKSKTHLGIFSFLLRIYTFVGISDKDNNDNENESDFLATVL